MQIFGFDVFPVIRKNKKTINKIEKKIISEVVGLKFEEGTGASVRQVHLTTEAPVSSWISYTSGKLNGLQFAVLPQLPDGTTAELGGQVKLQVINGQNPDREYAICDMVGVETATLDQIFYFTSEHIGKCGIELNLPKNGLFRLVLEGAGDVMFEIVIDY